MARDYDNPNLTIEELCRPVRTSDVALRQKRPKGRPNPKRGKRGPVATADEVCHVHELRSAGATIRRIRSETGLCLGTIQNILNGWAPDPHRKRFGWERKENPRVSKRPHDPH